MSAKYETYEVTAPAPITSRGWYWLLNTTAESAGPFRTQPDAINAVEKYLRSIGK